MKRSSAKKGLRNANCIIVKAVAMNGESEENVRVAIKEAIREARGSPNPVAKEWWD